VEIPANTNVAEDVSTPRLPSSDVMIRGSATLEAEWRTEAPAQSIHLIRTQNINV